MSISYFRKKKEKEKRRTVEDSLGLVGKERNVASDSVSACRTLLAQRIGRKGKGKMERTGREKRPCPPARCRHGALWKRYQYTVLNYFLVASVHPGRCRRVSWNDVAVCSLTGENVDGFTTRQEMRKQSGSKCTTNQGCWRPIHPTQKRQLCCHLITTKGPIRDQTCLGCSLLAQSSQKKTSQKLTPMILVW